MMRNESSFEETQELIIPKLEYEDSPPVPIREKKFRLSASQMMSLTPDEQLDRKRNRSRIHSQKYAMKKRLKFEFLASTRNEIERNLKSLQKANVKLEVELLEKIDVGRRSFVMKEMDSRRCQIQKTFRDDDKEAASEKRSAITKLEMELQEISFEKYKVITMSQKSTINSQKCRTKKKLEMAKLEWETHQMTTEYKIEKDVGLMLKDFGEKLSV